MPRKLRIAFYTDSYLPAHDGVVTSILNLRRELRSKGHRVFLFTSGNRRTRELVEGDRDVFVSKSMKFKKYPQYNIALLPFTTAMTLMKVKPDIIHAHTPFMMGSSALAIGKINRIPVVGTFHTMFADKSVIASYAIKMGSDQISKYAWSYAKFFYNMCDATIAPSPSIKKILVGKGVRNTVTVPNGIDIKRFNTMADGRDIRKHLQKSKDEKIVLYVGRTSYEKRLDTMLKAASLLKKENIRFVIGGTGPAAVHYHNLAHRFKVTDNTTFAGFIPEEQLPGYYAAADVFCIPSTFETQGLVALEAMACGKPVIGADSLALGDLIKDGQNGEKFAPGDSKECARKIKKAINNIRSYKETVKTAQEYSIGHITDETLGVYYRVLKDATL